MILVALLLFPLVASSAPRPLTRVELVEICVSRLQNRFIDEVETIRSGLLAPYPDGRMHLDWPATRGVAAGVMARLAITLGLPAQPSTFIDVGPSSPLAPLLAQVGAVFPPLEQGRFRTEQLVYREDLETMIRALSATAAPVSPALKQTDDLKPDAGDFVGGRHFSSGFSFSGKPLAHEPPGQSGSDTGAIDRITAGVPIEQLAPQSLFDLGLAQEGIEEIESRLPSLETTVTDLVGMKETTPEEDRRIIDALTSIGRVIDDSVAKLAFAQRQLNAVLLADPTAMRNALDLKARIVQDSSRLERIRRTLEPRLRLVPSHSTEPSK